jgi:hypothetical protein
VSSDAEVTKLQVMVVADEHVEWRQIAMQHLSAVQFAEDLENACYFSPRARLGKRRARALQKRAQISVTRVFQRQAIQRPVVAAQ